ncbi:GNAT family N-acetyltransferase [Streptomyces sp. WAC06614]|nr:GNAT family N-acetyltransferase [Streptomyces sp. WAC06614]
MRCFPSGVPGLPALAEHALGTGRGRWWADRPVEPRVLAVSCGDHVLLRGRAGVLRPQDLHPLAAAYVEAPEHFVPVLRAAFTRLDPWERMVYVRHAAPVEARPPRGVALRRLTGTDAERLADLGPQAQWIHGTWGGPHGLAGSGCAWGAFRRGRLLTVACTYVRGSRYEDVAVACDPAHRRRHLALACVNALCSDIEQRGRTPSWTCSRDHRPSRLLAWYAGFRLQQEHVHYATGAGRAAAPTGRPAHGA